ncbi:GNAT family N-acetyltransferase [Tunturiibacter gelidoferens]|uniref:GNAT family N-acetyltransferase n=1 Tax=Tunturiibacter gelidiferens TaxID=3069689 RepID=A0AAU7Z6U5_9BACT
MSHTSTPALGSDLATQLRTATPEDTGRLVPFINRAFARDNYFKRTERTNAEQVAEYLQKGTLLLKEDGDGLLGLIYIELRDNDHGYIGMVAVDPGWQSMGTGRELMKAGEQLCRDHDCRLIEISVIDLRPELLAWYQRQGYKIVGEAPYIRPEVLILPCHFILMEKELRPTNQER